MEPSNNSEYKRLLSELSLLEAEIDRLRSTNRKLRRYMIHTHEKANYYAGMYHQEKGARTHGTFFEKHLLNPLVKLGKSFKVLPRRHAVQ